MTSYARAIAVVCTLGLTLEPLHAIADQCRRADGGPAPLCRDGCGAGRPDDKVCKADDESCTTCGQWRGPGGGDPGPGNPTGDATINEENSRLNVIAWGQRENAPIHIRVEYRREDGTLLDVKTAEGIGSLRFDDSLAVSGPDANGDTAVIVGDIPIIGILIAAVITIAGVVYAIKHFRRGTGASCYGNPQIVPGGLCQYSLQCAGSHDCTSQTFYTRPPDVNGYCAAKIRKTWGYTGVQGPLGGFAQLGCGFTSYQTLPSTMSECLCR